MNLKVVGTVHVNKGLLTRQSDRAVIKFMEKKARHVKDLAKVKVGKRTGKLKRSIKIMNRKYIPGKYYSLQVGSEVSYAYAHHEGTRSYIIRPSNKRVLKFKTNSVIAIGRTDGMGNVYARSVRHPKVAPNKYLTDSMNVVFKGRSLV